MASILSQVTTYFQPHEPFFHGINLCLPQDLFLVHSDQYVPYSEVRILMVGARCLLYVWLGLGRWALSTKSILLMDITATLMAFLFTQTR